MISQAMVEGAKQRVRDANNGYLVTPIYEVNEMSIGNSGSVGRGKVDLLGEIRQDIVRKMKSGDKELVTALKVLVSDIQRDPHKDYSDGKVLPIIKKAVKTLYDNHDQFGNDRDLIDAEYLERCYLPTMVTAEEITEFLGTVDFSQFKNKMQAIGLVQKHFPAGTVDGAVAKNVVQGYEA